MTTTQLLLLYSLFADLFLSIGVLAVMTRRGLLRQFLSLAAFLAVSIVSDSIAIPLIFFRRYLFGISPIQAYYVYYYSEWAIELIEYSLLVLLIYSVFRQAMRPLVGLHRAGQVVFRWVGGVSVAVSLAFALGSHSAAGGWTAAVLGQVMQAICVLILCLLLFVCFSTRYLGLTYRSHAFGVALGLGVWAMANLVEAAWVARSAVRSVYSPVYVFMGLCSCACSMIWGAYFALPQPAAKMVLLPTTSPYFLWNRISEALGDEPGVVAIAGFKPSMLAPAEMTVLEAGFRQAQMRELEQAAEAEREAEMVESSAHSLSLASMALTGSSMR